MARWDKILSLPVQNPASLEFSAADIVWSRVEGWCDNLDKLALIPFARVGDFVRGEGKKEDCPTRFHVEARRRKNPQASFKQKVDGILEYILYWCSYGPDDHRKGGVVRPSRNTYVKKKANAGRPSTKRGCTCHFIVKRLIAEPTVALIIYNQDKHVDKMGLPCHGPQDKKAEGTRAMYAPSISDDLRLRVMSLLYVGVSVETIMQRHNESVERQGGPCNRDDLLTHRFVRGQERRIRRSTYELDEDDAVSIGLWVESHQSHVFFYEDFSDSDPFTLGIQTEWQLQQMIRFGNRSLLASDSRVGTNKLKYPVHSVVVFNSENKAIPVAWIIAPRFASTDSYKWMRALYNRVCNKDPTFKLAGFIVDDPLIDVTTIRDVFQCSVLISFWRVRHSWHKNLLKRCSEKEKCVEILKQLGQAVGDICRRHGAMDFFDPIMEDFVEVSNFVEYFKAVWYPRLGAWTTALKCLPLAGLETSTSMEFYHNQLKLRVLNEKNPDLYQQSDWLVNKLGTKVHSYFWLDEYSEKDDFSRYSKDEWVSGLTSWQKALKIPNSHVRLEGKLAQVTDQVDQGMFYTVRNPGSEFATCDCSWSEMGYLCEHVCKVVSVFRDKGCIRPSVCMIQFKQALIDMLHCPPHDSLIRDHAFSLAIAVQRQLEAVVRLGHGEATVDPIPEQTSSTLEWQTSGGVSGDQDRALVSESHLMDEDTPLQNENSEDGRHVAAVYHKDCGDKVCGAAGSCEDRRMSPGDAPCDAGTSNMKEIACSEIDIEPSSNCITPPGAIGGKNNDSSDCIDPHDNHGMDVDPPSEMLSLSTRDLTVQPETTNSADTSVVSDNASPSLSKMVELQMIDRVERSASSMIDQGTESEIATSLHQETCISNAFKLVKCTDNVDSGDGQSYKEIATTPTTVDNAVGLQRRTENGLGMSTAGDEALASTRNQHLHKLRPTCTYHRRR